MFIFNRTEILRHSFLHYSVSLCHVVSFSFCFNAFRDSYTIIRYLTCSSEVAATITFILGAHLLGTERSNINVFVLYCV